MATNKEMRSVIRYLNTLMYTQKDIDDHIVTLAEATKHNDMLIGTVKWIKQADELSARYKTTVRMYGRLSDRNDEFLKALKLAESSLQSLTESNAFDDNDEAARQACTDAINKANGN